ncbi:MAG TPA: imidazole glycerol phosphate synthase subunit HisH [Armatimonadota bacterium]
MIAVVDYGMGNLRSVVKGFEQVEVAAVVTADPREVAAASAVVLPGVGAFGMAMDHLRASGLDVVIKEAILAGKPFLGICLGLQLLFTESEEFGPVRGLDVLPGRVVRFFPDGAPDEIKIPHMGWNRITQQAPTPVLKGVPDGEHFYFVHSYYVAPEDPSLTATTTEYGGFQFTSSVARGTLFACQFHPEKSSAMGLRMLKNFGEMARGASPQ